MHIAWTSKGNTTRYAHTPAHTILIDNWGAQFNDRDFRNGWIDMLFMLVEWVENQ